MAKRNKRAPRFGHYVKLAAWSALMTPLSVLLHELGHFTIARAFGYPARLKATSVAADLDRAPEWIQLLQSTAGPLVTLVITIIAASLYSRRPSRRWALSLAVAAPHRYLVVSAYLGALGAVTLLGGRMGGTPNFDEYNTARAAGAPIIAVAIAITLALILYWIWLVRRIPRGSRIGSILAIVAGAGAGMYSWVAVAPPVLAALQSG